MQSVAGDDTALQNQAFQRRQRRRHLVAARGVPGRQRQPRLSIPDAHHKRRHKSTAAFIAAPQALAVDRDHALGRIESEPFAQRLGEAAESFSHLLRIEQTKQAAEAVMARRAMAKIDNLDKLLLMGGNIIGEIDTRFRPTQSRRQRNRKHCRRSCRALKSRGSRTSRKIEMSVSIEALPNQKDPLQNQLFPSAQ